MNGHLELPRAALPFVQFPILLRANGFAVAPDQTSDFLAAIELLGPRHIGDIRAAARATLAPAPEQRDEFDALFDAFFLGRVVSAPTSADTDPEEDTLAFDERGGRTELPESEEIDEAGAQATAMERLAMRVPLALSQTESLRNFARHAPRRLPARRSRRHMASHRGNNPDLRRALRMAVHRDGELITLPVRRRRLRQRRLVLLIDISGSMKSHTDQYLSFAHMVARTAERCEIFTLGTRLTRITSALRIRDRRQALQAVAGLVADWDGGTRIGGALEAFLAVPRFSGFARGAMVVVLSDGLERGETTPLVNAVTRLSRISWAILWLTPLAGGEGFEPQTEAMQAIAPLVDHIGGGATLAQLSEEVLQFKDRVA